MDLRAVFFKWDLVAAVQRAPRVIVLPATGLGLVGTPADAEPIPWLGSRVEMGMPPHLRRHKDGSRLPVDASKVAALGSFEQRVAMAANGQHVDARAVAVERGVHARLGSERDAATDRAIHEGHLAAMATRCSK